MRSLRRHRFVTTLLLALVTTACATTKRHGALVVDDVRAIGRSARDADARDWARAGAVVAAVAATTALDDEARDVTHGERLDRLSANVTPFGGRYSDRVLAGFLVAGLARRDARAKAVAFDGFVTSLLASKIATPALKAVIPRQRPGGGDESFPSNHATQAFGVASVIDAHYERRWVGVAAYGVATLVAWARVHDDVHYLSDVVAGAVIGTAVGRLVVRTNERSRSRWTIAPAPGGAVVTIRF